jgi:hypothetical protein
MQDDGESMAAVALDAGGRGVDGGSDRAPRGKTGCRGRRLRSAQDDGMPMFAMAAVDALQGRDVDVGEGVCLSCWAKFASRAGFQYS